MRKLILLVAALAAGAVFVGSGAAIPQGDHGTKFFGPYESLTTDSGTCGVDWATDHVYRVFSIKPTGGINYDVKEFFFNGTFTTMAAPVPSPGACDNSDHTGPGTVNAGIHGQFGGYDQIAVTSPTYHPETAACAYPCFSTSDFLASVFGPVFTRDDYAWAFEYHARDQGLIYRHWRNASCNRGGNHGDIQSAAAPFAELAACP
jgi:hypothetical protein